MNTFSFQLCTDIAVIEVGFKSCRELIGNVSDQVSVFPFVLELTLPIAIATILARNRHQTPRRNLHSLHTHNQVLCLCTIGADVLDSRSSYVARNQREVFHPIEACLQRSLNNLVKHLTTATGHPITIDIIAQNIRAHDNTLEVFRQQEITTATYYYIRYIRLAQDLSHLLSLLNTRIFQETTALGINAKCIMILQTIVLEIPHYSLFTSKCSFS